MCLSKLDVSIKLGPFPNLQHTHPGKNLPSRLPRDRVHGRTYEILKPVREGRRAENVSKLCVFLDYTAISENI